MERLGRGEVAGDGSEGVFLQERSRRRLGMTGFSWTAAEPRAAVALSARPVATLRAPRTPPPSRIWAAPIARHQDFCFVPSIFTAACVSPDFLSDGGAGELLTSLK